MSIKIIVMLTTLFAMSSFFIPIERNTNNNLQNADTCVTACCAYSWSVENYEWGQSCDSGGNYYCSDCCMVNCDVEEN